MGPVLTWTTDAMLGHAERLLQIPGEHPWIPIAALVLISAAAWTDVRGTVSTMSYCTECILTVTPCQFSIRVLNH